MDDNIRDEVSRLKAALAAQEALRPQWGDALVDTTIGALKEKLSALEQAVARAAERKQVTVLFADLVGFTPLAERLDPEDVGDVMAAYFRHVTAPLLERGGSIEKYIGDAVMAVFGLPAARENDAAEAVWAGLDMQQALSELNEELARERGLRLSMRVGIHTGLVLHGRLGTEAPDDVTVVGDTVNLASRLEGAAPPGGVLISQATYDQVRGLFAVEACPLLSVKGKAEPVQTYRVLSAKARAFHMPTRGLAGITTRTVGRDRELDVLHEAYRHAQAGAGLQWITLSGEAGVGKSRVLAEFEQWLELQPEAIWYLKGRAWPHAMHSPYFLLRDILAFRFQLGEGDSPAEARHKLAAGLGDILGWEMGAEAAAFLGQLIGLDFRDSPWIAGIADDTPQIHGRARILLYETLARATAASAGPPVMLLEDLQWADAESLALLASLLQAAPGWRLCIAATARPDLWERGTAWQAVVTGGSSLHRRLELSRLPGEEAGELVRELLQKVDEPPDWLVSLLLERGGGNPYFTEELMQWLIDRGVIRTGVDRWDVGEGVDAGLAVPETIQGVLQARLERLMPQERATLQHAAVIGRAFWDGAVAYIGQEVVPAVRWAGLEERDLIAREPVSQLPDDDEYHFRHALLRDVVYEYTLKARRRLFHRRAAEWLIQKTAARADEWAAIIAGHWEHAGERDLAATWYGRAGERARAAYAPRTAMEYYQKALGFVERHGAGDTEKTRLVISWYDGLGWMMHSQSRSHEAVAAFEAMLRVARSVGDLAAQARALNGLSQIHDGAGDHRAALEYAGQAAAVAAAAGTNGGIELAVALLRQGWALYRLGKTEAARDLAGRAARLGAEQEPPARDAMARSLNLLGMAHDALGNVAEALRYKQEALAWCREAGDRRGMGTMLNNLGVNAEQRLDFGAAAALYEQALTVVREIGHRDGEMLCLTNLAGARAELGQYAAAELEARQVLAMPGTGEWFGRAHIYIVLAEALCGQGRTHEALHAAGKALEIAQGRGQQYYEGGAWCTLARIAAQLTGPIQVGGRLYDPTECFANSARILSGLGARVDHARTLETWAEYEYTRGHWERGEPLRQQAQDLFRQLGLVGATRA